MINVSVGPCTYRRILKVKAGLQFTHHTAVSRLQQLFSVDLCVILKYYIIIYIYIPCQGTGGYTKIKGRKHWSEARDWSTGLGKSISVSWCLMTLHDSFDITEHWSGKKLDSVLDHSFNIIQYKSSQVLQNQADLCLAPSGHSTLNPSEDAVQRSFNPTRILNLNSVAPWPKRTSDSGLGGNMLYYCTTAITPNNNK